MYFKNRTDAGKQLATQLEHMKNLDGLIIIGLPRGGVPVAHEIAKQLGVQLDIIVTRKIGAPMNPEFAVGAVTENGTVFLDQEVLRRMHLSREALEPIINTEQREAARRLTVYRGLEKAPLNLSNNTVVLVDDGVATGATMRAAIRSAKEKGAKTCIVAVPVIARDTLEQLTTQESDVTDIVALIVPETFIAVGEYYSEFSPTTDKEVIRLLHSV